jgi:hypothetical protein
MYSREHALTRSLHLSPSPGATRDLECLPRECYWGLLSDRSCQGACSSTVGWGRVCRARAGMDEAEGNPGSCVRLRL